MSDKRWFDGADDELRVHTSEDCNLDPILVFFANGIWMSATQVRELSEYLDEWLKETNE